MKAKIIELLNHYVTYLIGHSYSNPENGVDLIPEVEVHFSSSTTTAVRNAAGGGDHHQFNKHHYNQVISRLSEFGFFPDEENGGGGGGGGGEQSGTTMLRIFSESQQEKGGRWEIHGIDLVEEYCASNSLSSVLEKLSSQNEFLDTDLDREKNLARVKYTKKTFPSSLDSSLTSIRIDDFQYKISYKMENTLHGVPKDHPSLDNWKSDKKKFRYMNRLRFRHKKYPLFADLTILKSSSNMSDPKKFYLSVDESNLLTNVETYEIELELDNDRILADMLILLETKSAAAAAAAAADHDDEKAKKSTQQRVVDVLMDGIRICVSIVLQGTQNSLFPISVKKQEEVLSQYQKLMFPSPSPSSSSPSSSSPSSTTNRGPTRASFIGPSSVTLLPHHLMKGGEDKEEEWAAAAAAASSLIATHAHDEPPRSRRASSIPNIYNQPYCVTEKANGERRLMFIHIDRGLYMFDSVMNVYFTGYYCDSKELINTLLDGEWLQLARVDGSGGGGSGRNPTRYVFLAFDVYLKSGEWKFELPFVDSNIKNQVPEFSRLMLLQCIVEQVSFDLISKKNHRFDLQCKEFLYGGGKQITDHCDTILNHRSYPYPIDGLVFSPLAFGVGALNDDQQQQQQHGSCRLHDVYKKKWIWSLKWKPPHENTIDFLVEIRDTPSILSSDEGEEEGDGGVIMYKTLELLCGYDESKYGIHDPFLSVLRGFTNNRGFTNRSVGGGGGAGTSSSSYRPVFFIPDCPVDRTACLCNIKLEFDSNTLRTEANERIENKSIIEFRYDHSKKGYWKWIPVRVRHDKTREYRMGYSTFGNDYKVANSIWASIHNPVTKEMITGREEMSVRHAHLDHPDFSSQEVQINEVYYHRKNTFIDMENTKSLRDFHNLCVKKSLIECAAKFTKRRQLRNAESSAAAVSLIDFAVGKAGDLNKWIHSGIEFVLGIDVCSDNILNKFDGACVRYLKKSKTPTMQKLPSCLFLCGDSRENVRDGSAFQSPPSSSAAPSSASSTPPPSSLLEKEISEVVFDKNAHALIAKRLGAGGDSSSPLHHIERIRGVASSGFDISSMQFSIHYMMKNPMTLHGFLKNVSQCTKLEGLFIGTCMDGEKLFRFLKRKRGHAQWHQSDRLIYEIQQKFSSDHVWRNDWTCLGLAIDVFIDTINQRLTEFLVNYAFLEKILFAYGFVPLKPIELEEIEFPSRSHSSGSFEEMFEVLLEKEEHAAAAAAAATLPRRRQRPLLSTHYHGNAFFMSDIEKEVSFLNRFFVFKKVRNVSIGNSPLFPCHRGDGGGGHGRDDATGDNDDHRQKLEKVDKLIIHPDKYLPVETDKKEKEKKEKTTEKQKETEKETEKEKGAEKETEKENDNDSDTENEKKTDEETEEENEADEKKTEKDTEEKADEEETDEKSKKEKKTEPEKGTAAAAAGKKKQEKEKEKSEKIRIQLEKKSYKKAEQERERNEAKMEKKRQILYEKERKEMVRDMKRSEKKEQKIIEAKANK